MKALENEMNRQGGPIKVDEGISAYRLAALWCGAIAAAFGLLGLLGWLTDRPLLSSLSPQYVPMSPRTALGLMLLGLALFLHVRRPAQRSAHQCARLFACLAMVLGAASLIEIIVNLDAFRGVTWTPPARFTDYVVIRMSRVTAVAFILSGGGILALATSARRFSAWLVPLSSLTVAGGSFVILLGYLYGTPLLYGGYVRPVDLSSGIAFLFLSVGLMAAAGPRYWPSRMWTGPSLTARLLRVFLPITFAVVLLSELFSDAFRAFPPANPALEAALQTLISTLVVTFAVFYVARFAGGALDRADQALRQARDDLERQVEARTAELTTANVGLKSEIVRREQTEEALRQSVERFRQLAENVREVFWVTDLADNRILYVSPGYETIWGRTCQGLYDAPESWLDPILPDDRARVRQAALTKKASGDYHEIYRVVRPDGSVRWIRDRAFPVRDQAGNVYRIVGVAEDITEQKRLEGAILETSAREQRRIGCDLHDGLGQLLTGIAIKAKLLEGALTADAPPHAPAAGRLVKLLNQSVHQTRMLARGLDPLYPHSHSLTSALERLALDTRELFGVECVFTGNHPGITVGEEVGLQLYRIAQEAISNAVRHGKARRIEINLSLDTQGLSVTIRDDGQGFVTQQTPEMGMGLRIMQHRAHSIGGMLDIHSAPQAGTSVRCVVSKSSAPDQ